MPEKMVLSGRLVKTDTGIKMVRKQSSRLKETREIRVNKDLPVNKESRVNKESQVNKESRVNKESLESMVILISRAKTDSGTRMK